jgi:type II restriction/modification system DNA methylase subunit YeeA
MVENSLGRLWIEKLIAGGDVRSEKEIAGEFGWKYYIPEAEQSLKVKEQIIEIRKDRKNIQLEDIRFIDPAMGSFHIGIYAFEVFMQLYESQGYTAREAAKLIIEKNLYGLDIDKRAYQLSYFACMMKGRQYNRRILTGEIKNNLYAIPESNKINRKHLDYLGSNIADKKTWDKAKNEIVEILDIFYDAKEYGSILKVPNKYDFTALKEFVLSGKSKTQISLESVGIEDTQEEILEILCVAEVLSQKYDILSTNPPYMGSSGMNPKLSKYLKDNYPDSKSDLFAVFMERCREFAKGHGCYAMITQHSWMFLSSYEKLRKKLQTNTIHNMVHLGPRAFEEIGGEVVQTTAFVLKNASINDYKGSYVRLIDFSNAEEKEIKALEAIQNPNCGYYYETEQDNFEKIPGMPIAYWVSEKIIKSFIADNLENHSQAIAKGIFTGDNDRFLKLWYEVSYTSLNEKWFKYSKGGPFRKWYGNFEYVVFWMNNGELLRRFKGSGLGASRFFGKKTIVWTKITSSNISFRYNLDVMFDDASPAIIFRDKADNYLLGFLNSKIVQIMINIIAPTMNLQIGDVKKLPYPLFGRNEFKNIVFKIVEHNISISRTDWDSFETSWDFKVHPLLNKKFNPMHLDINTRLPNKTIESAYEIWKAFANSNFNQLKANEEELNRIFIEIYGLEDELTPEISDKDITITKIFDSKEEIYDDIKGNRYILTKEDVIKSFISYAVGCMFGRYSPDVEGLAYAGGEFKEQLKIENGEWKIRTEDGWISSSIDIAEDNIIVITDEEYLGNDIVSRFVDFVRVSYGEESLEKNLKFIADALGGRGTPRETIRNYFLKDFYNDHVRTYQKRPIYWLYDSGRQNGFKALIYMHRYNEDTTGKVRVDYLHETQKAYERTIDNLRDDIEHNKNPREVVKSEKCLTKVTKQLKECKDYDERIAHLALARIPIDLDDGVKVNYDKVQTDEKGKHLNILAKIR